MSRFVGDQMDIVEQRQFAEVCGEPAKQHGIECHPSDELVS
jgi:hypothetical protein